MAYYRLEPFGPERIDAGLAQICKMLYDINKSKEAKDLSVQDFMLFHEKEENKGLTGPAGAAMARAMFQALPEKYKKKNA